jgi:hypothetical protein
VRFILILGYLTGEEREQTFVKLWDQSQTRGCQRQSIALSSNSLSVSCALNIILINKININK